MKTLNRRTPTIRFQASDENSSQWLSRFTLHYLVLPCGKHSIWTGTSKNVILLDIHAYSAGIVGGAFSLGASSQHLLDRLLTFTTYPLHDPRTQTRLRYMVSVCAQGYGKDEKPMTTTQRTVKIALAFVVVPHFFSSAAAAPTLSNDAVRNLLTKREETTALPVQIWVRSCIFSLI